MGVATRGVKFKFTEGEKVLCYEPDPTKAKVLYESKVLDLVVGRDERGRKVPEYLIHFYGWNSSWDRCVREEFILPYTDENIDLQYKLASEAALAIKGKRKSKLPPLLKDSLVKKQRSESNNDKPESPESSQSESDSESSEDESEKQVILNIPEILKKQLEKDWHSITKKNKLVKVPCNPNVIMILETFVKNLVTKLLLTSPQTKDTKCGALPEDVRSRMNLVKEVADGIRIYFDFTLPDLLLYQQEKMQFCANAPCPVSNRSSLNSCGEAPEVLLKVEKVEVDSNEVASPVRGRPRKGRPPKLHRPALEPSPPQAKIKVEENNSVETKPSPENCSKRSPAKRGRPRLSSNTRILRSSDKQSEPRSPRRSRRLSHSSPTAPPPDPPPPPSTPGPSVPPDAGGLRQTCIAHADLLRELLTWRLAVQEEAAPSFLYGAHHLLRLFVKLPDMITKQNLSRLKRQSLQHILENLLAYLVEKQDVLFPTSAYVDSNDFAAVQ
ncbi:male-specific lethal 3 homolog [Caerostris darwini]|uniref:Protein male-specific lethal-3 n=1 Tax=Caerostris darwini TaxID=1538125 RepID=A0AAV4WL20_9ARAC|nr:male-specific lethal 3 homolog [Caerostris darwini]